MLTHFTDEETGPEKLRNVPKVTQLVRARPEAPGCALSPSRALLRAPSSQRLQLLVLTLIIFHSSTTNRIYHLPRALSLTPAPRESTSCSGRVAGCWGTRTEGPGSSRTLPWLLRSPPRALLGGGGCGYTGAYLVLGRNGPVSHRGRGSPLARPGFISEFFLGDCLFS